MNENTEAQPPDAELHHQRADFPDPAFDDTDETDETPLEDEDEDDDVEGNAER